MDDQRKLLAAQDWATLGKELTAYAVRLARRFGLLPDLLPRGGSVVDVVGDVIVELHEGRPPWNSADVPLVAFMKMRIKNKLGHLAAHAEVQREKAALLGQEDSTSPPDAGRFDAQRYIEGLYQAVEDEPELVAVLDELRDGTEPKPRFLARALGVKVAEIDRRLRRLRRRALKVIERLERTTPEGST